MAAEYILKATLGYLVPIAGSVVPLPEDMLTS